MNHSKIILVGCISAFVALTTVFLGVAGTIIGSVLSSVLYNVLSELLEEPVENARFSTNFEWDIAYVFPLVVVLFIQLLLILAFLSEWGFLPKIFLNIYLSIQGVAANNLYRILGFSLVVMSVYPFVLKRDIVKKSDGIIILIIGIMFLLRGFSDIVSSMSYTYGLVYDFVDFPIALIAFLLLIYVIHNILSKARESEKEFNFIKRDSRSDDLSDLELKDVHRKKSARNLNDLKFKRTQRSNNNYQRTQRANKNYQKYSRSNNNYQRTQRSDKNYQRPPKNGSLESGKINKSANDFQFESNDLLDDYKK